MRLLLYRNKLPPHHTTFVSQSSLHLQNLMMLHLQCSVCHSLDVDECLLGSHVCRQLCVNVPGSFYCSCRTGYLLEDDLTHCIGVCVCVCVLCARVCVCACACVCVLVCVCAGVCLHTYNVRMCMHKVRALQPAHHSRHQRMCRCWAQLLPHLHEHTWLL